MPNNIENIFEQLKQLYEEEKAQKDKEIERMTDMLADSEVKKDNYECRYCYGNKN